jgi:hypothetical protein
VVLAGDAAVAALFGTGVIGGEARKSEEAFVSEVNDRVLGPLGLADETAAAHADAADPATWASDGQRIVRAANGGWTYLRALRGLSTAQTGDVQLLLGVVAANRGYGRALAVLTPDDAQGNLALDGAATAARAAIESARSGLSADLRLPSQSAIVAASALPATTTTSETTTTTAGPTAAEAGYVQHVDGLLLQSHGVVLAVRSFVRRAAGDQISRSPAVTLARSLAGQRRTELRQAQGFAVAPGFELAHQLLVLSLQASLADDEALVAWAVARRDGTGTARAEFARANRLGARATGLKRRFLREYGLRRQAATGLTPRTLPKDF